MNFGKLGNQFQQALIKSIIEDPKYGEQILEVLESRYFDNNSFKYIITHIKELQEHYKSVPNYETLKQKIMSETSGNALAAKLHGEHYQQLKNWMRLLWVKLMLKTPHLIFVNNKI